jgi:hypothetical protein
MPETTIAQQICCVRCVRQRTERCLISFYDEFNSSEEHAMSLGTILLIILILMLIGAIPSWPHSKSWGYGPSGGLGLVVIILIVLLLTGSI